MFVFWWRPPCLLRTVIVNLHDDTHAIRGVLWQSRGPWLTLHNASLLTTAAPPSPIDGAALVHRDQIAFIQVLP